MYHVGTQYEGKHDLDNENKRIRSCIGKAEKTITVMSHQKSACEKGAQLRTMSKWIRRRLTKVLKCKWVSTSIKIP